MGVFPSEDPKSHDELAKKGQIAFDLGKFFEKGLTMGSGQTNVKQYNRHLSPYRGRKGQALLPCFTRIATR